MPFWQEIHHLPPLFWLKCIKLGPYLNLAELSLHFQTRLGCIICVQAWLELELSFEPRSISAQKFACQGWAWLELDKDPEPSPYRVLDRLKLDSIFFFLKKMIWVSHASPVKVSKWKSNTKTKTWVV